nr:hypothetical protein [uncultured Undibacterium sp.]
MGLTASLTGHHVDEVLTNRDTTDVSATTFPAYTLLNLNPSLSKDDRELILWISNLTNSHAQVSSQPIGITVARPIRTLPRTMGLNLSCYFKLL